MNWVRWRMYKLLLVITYPMWPLNIWCCGRRETTSGDWCTGCKAYESWSSKTKVCGRTSWPSLSPIFHVQQALTDLSQSWTWHSRTGLGVVPFIPHQDWWYFPRTLAGFRVGNVCTQLPPWQWCIPMCSCISSHHSYEPDLHATCLFSADLEIIFFSRWQNESCLNPFPFWNGENTAPRLYFLIPSPLGQTSENLE